ncbi:transposase (plasmid) [Kitasatospora sp. NBC_00070]|uniref:hypothetical protein n=1 Tax=Kitasatospora sp. NBC_00070 TaxID=2975962 RepID=UPI002F90AEE7
MIRPLAQRIPQELIEAEATARIGAEPGERTETRSASRSEVSRICADLDEQLTAFRAPPRNTFAIIPKDAGETVAATIRTIFAQPAEAAARTQLDTVARRGSGRRRTGC